MELERISARGAGELEYVLIIDRQTDSIEKRLLENGNEFKKWEQKLFQGGAVQEEWEYEQTVPRGYRRYSQSGQVILEIEYINGLPSDSVQYTYDSDRLSQVEKYDSEGTSRFRETYLYTKRGRLREIVRLYPNGSVWTASFSFDSEGLAEERIKQDREMYLGTYALNGVLDSWQVRNDGIVSEEKLWEYFPESGEVRRITKRLPGEGITVEELYDTEGNIVSRTVSGGSQEEVAYSRNDQGLLIEKTRISADGKENWLYAYDEEGEVLSEAYYRKTSLEKVRYYTAKDMWFDELYRDNAVFLRVYYEKQEKVKEEIIGEGQVIRTRIYLE